MPIRLLMITGSTVLLSYILMPSRMTWPLAPAPGVISCIRLRQRIRVVLPQPEGPIKAVAVLALTSKLMFFKACFDPYHASRFLIDTLYCLTVAELLPSALSCKGSTTLLLLILKLSLELNWVLCSVLTNIYYLYR